MKKIKQFVYYGKNDQRNSPLDANDWTSNLFKNYNRVTHLGIQGESGVLFCLNGSKNENAISIGPIGIYEINLENVGYISSIRFLEDSLDEHYVTNPTSQTKLIVDIVYEEVD